MPPGSAPASGSVCAKAVDFSPRNTGPKDAGPARRQRHRARQLLGDDRNPEQAQILAAELGRHLEEPQPQLARLGLELLADLGLEIGPVHRLHLDRDQLLIDEAPDRVFQDADIRGKLEIHSSGFRHDLQSRDIVVEFVSVAGSCLEQPIGAV
jgi:hypothetical protein